MAHRRTAAAATTPTARWLAVAEGLWLAVVAELNPCADWASTAGMLDAMQWRVARQVSGPEFTALFEAWRVAGLRGNRAVDGKPSAFAGFLGHPPEGEAQVAVGSAMFCAELVRRSIQDDELTLMFGMVVNECNRVVIGMLEAAPPDRVQSLRMRLALSEKVFFNMDTQGRGCVTVDDVFALALASRLDAASASPRSAARRFSLADVAADCMALLRDFGGSSFYSGAVTLRRFKERCVADLVRRASSSPGPPPHALNDMALQKMLVGLSKLKEAVAAGSHSPAIAASRGGAAGLWESAIADELDADLQAADADPALVQLSRFLSVRGARVRWTSHRPGEPWGTDAEIDAMWRAFAGPSGGVPGSRALRMRLARVTYRFVSLLTSLLSTVFPHAFDPAVQVFLRSEDEGGGDTKLDEVESPSSVESPANSAHRKPMGSGSAPARAVPVPAAPASNDSYNEPSGLSGRHRQLGSPSGPNRYAEDEDDLSSGSFEDALEGDEAFVTASSSRMALDSVSGSDLDLTSGPAMSAPWPLRSPFEWGDADEQADVSSEVDSNMSPGAFSSDSETGRIDGAFYIEAFRLFQAEKVQVFGHTAEEAAALWNTSTNHERRVYVDMARAMPTRSREAHEGASAPRDWAQGPAGRAILLPEHAERLYRAAAAEPPAQPDYLENLDTCKYEAYSVDAVIEQILANRYLSGDDDLRPVQSFAWDKARHGPHFASQDAKANPGSSEIAPTPLRQGVLHFQTGSHSLQRSAFLFVLDSATSELRRHALDTGQRIEALCLSGARIGSTIAEALPLASASRPSSASSGVLHKFVAIPARGEPWILFADSAELLEGWARDIGFAIAEEAVRSASAGFGARSSPLESGASRVSPRSLGSAIRSSPALVSPSSFFDLEVSPGQAAVAAPRRAEVQSQTRTGVAANAVPGEGAAHGSVVGAAAHGVPVAVSGGAANGIASGEVERGAPARPAQPTVRVRRSSKGSADVARQRPPHLVLEHEPLRADAPRKLTPPTRGAPPPPSDSDSEGQDVEEVHTWVDAAEAQERSEIPANPEIGAGVAQSVDPVQSGALVPSPAQHDVLPEQESADRAPDKLEASKVADSDEDCSSDDDEQLRQLAVAASLLRKVVESGALDGRDRSSADLSRPASASELL